MIYSALLATPMEQLKGKLIQHECLPRIVSDRSGFSQATTTAAEIDSGSSVQRSDRLLATGSESTWRARPMDGFHG